MRNWIFDCSRWATVLWNYPLWHPATTWQLQYRHYEQMISGEEMHPVISYNMVRLCLLTQGWGKSRTGTGTGVFKVKLGWGMGQGSL